MPDEVGPREVLLGDLGMGLKHFLNRQKTGDTKKRQLTKSPSVKNVEYFFDFFPDSRLLIIMRDGRAVTESGVRSFGWDYDWAMRRWAEGARRILQFKNHPGDHEGKFLIVRYEDLAADTEAELRRIFEYVDLDPDRFDFAGAIDLPLYGSSDLIAMGEKEIHWKPVKKPADFDPLRRFAGWSRARHERFNWIAGPYQTELGYTLDAAACGGGFWSMWNWLCDRQWGWITLSPVRNAVKRL